MRLALALCLASTPVFADVSKTLSEHVLPGHDALVKETQQLSSSG